MTTVGIIGAGRVGSAVAGALAARGHPIVGVADSDAEAARRLATSLRTVPSEAGHLAGTAELTLLTVPDDSIGALAAELAPPVAAAGATDSSLRSLVHCSGALDLSPLGPMAAAGWTVGSWHPLQAFPSSRTPVAEGITWAITADPPLRDVLIGLTQDLDGHPRILAPEARRQYHAAAVLASNYVVTLASHAADLLTGCGLSREEALDALIPLMRTTIDGLADARLPGGLTGPLVRGDVGTVAGHLAAIADRPSTAQLYRSLGRATEPILAERGLSAPLLERIRLVLNTPGGPPETTTGALATALPDIRTDDDREVPPRVVTHAGHQRADQ